MSEDSHQEEYRSKSQVKRDMAALQDLGAELVKLSAAQLAHLDLPEELREAVEEARRIHQRGAHQRQLHYIGRLLRSVDAAPIRAGLERLRSADREAAALHHRIEHWRERLIAEGDAAAAELIAAHPTVDRQRLRQLMRNARHERDAPHPPRAVRELYRFLRELMAS